MMAVEISGQRFDRLVVIARAPSSQHGKARWRCRCDCGRETVADGTELRRGNVKSCGCLLLDAGLRTKKNFAWHKTRSSWKNMIARCTDPTHIGHKDYAGRGITVCKRWLVFENFLADMGERPPGMTLERINNDDGYELKNCRWATPRDQANNRRSNRRVAFRGGLYTIAEISRMTGVNKITLAWRLRNGRPMLCKGEQSLPQ